MGGGGSQKEKIWPPLPIAGAKLIDAPILFFVLTHKAFRAELASLHHVAAEAANTGDVRRELLVDLDWRLRFLKLVYNYHTVAEDEVIFLALDAEVKNVVPIYSLEHSSVDVNFGCIFDHLDILMKKDEGKPVMFQALISSISIVQAIICHHMHKEEEQEMGLWTLLKGCLLLANAHAILNDDRVSGPLINLLCNSLFRTIYNMFSVFVLQCFPYVTCIIYIYKFKDELVYKICKSVKRKY